MTGRHIHVTLKPDLTPQQVNAYWQWLAMGEAFESAEDLELRSVRHLLLEVEDMVPRKARNRRPGPSLSKEKQ